MRWLWCVPLLLVGCASPQPEPAQTVDPCDLEARAEWVQPSLYASLAEDAWLDEDRPSFPYDESILVTPSHPPRLDHLAFGEAPLTPTLVLVPDHAGVRVIVYPLESASTSARTAFLDAMIRAEDRQAVDDAVQTAFDTNQTQRLSIPEVHTFQPPAAVRYEQTMSQFMGMETWTIVVADNATMYGAWEARFSPWGVDARVAETLVSVSANGFASAEVTLRHPDQDPVERIGEILARAGLPAPSAEDSIEYILASQHASKPVAPSMRVGDPSHARWWPSQGGWQPVCKIVQGLGTGPSFVIGPDGEVVAG